MLLTEKYASQFSLFFSFSPKKPPPPPAGGESKPFEQTLITRLNCLLPLPNSSPSIPLSWLSRAIDLLTLTLADLTTIFSHPNLPPTDLSSHLHSTIALLDACNAISSKIDQILHNRLLLRLISSRPDPIHRARSAISDFEAAAASPQPDLSRLRPHDVNYRRLSSVRRAIYAVEAISDLVARFALAFLGRKGGFFIGFHVSSDFAWAEVYNEIVAKVSGEICCKEIEAVEISVRKLAVVVDEEDGGGESTEVLRGAVRGVEEAMEELTEGLDRLVVAVNAVFRAGLESREAALQSFRLGAGRCN